jgi:hypothetical protein
VLRGGIIARMMFIIDIGGEWTLAPCSRTSRGARLKQSPHGFSIFPCKVTGWWLGTDEPVGLPHSCKGRKSCVRRI